jgi:predicted aldo/keto reductase-like oxidoreductase
MDDETTRREFIQWPGLAASVELAEQVLAQTVPAGPAGMPTRILGRTKTRVPIAGLGGWHIGSIKDDREAIRVMHAAIDEGMTFFDNAWDYQDGHAEDVMGRALSMDNRRHRVFLMTKNCERDYQGSLRNLEESLRRLRTDHIDLWQFHEVVYDNDPDWVFERGGIRAAMEARRQGKVRFVGFSGHKDPRIHLKMLAKPYDWDAAQMPINVMDAQFRSFQAEVVPVCLSKNIGVIGMKGLGGGSPEGRLTSKARLTAEECYRFALSAPVATQVMGITSMQQLKENLAIVRAFRPMMTDERRKLLARVAEVAGDGRHELYKTSRDFDGPHHRKQHGFEL